MNIFNWFKKVSVPAARWALFIIFFWFGFLKIVGSSPAGPLVEALYGQTMYFIPFNLFYGGFAAFECLIGILFLFPKLTKVALSFFFLHMITAFAPLVFLPGMVWQGIMVPTLEGQYIVKNLALIALAIEIGASQSSS